MPFENAEDLMRALLAAKSSSELRGILDQIGDHQNLSLDEPFGSFQFSWHPFGDNPSNSSSIGLGTKPGRSLTERITKRSTRFLRIAHHKASSCQDRHV